MYAKLALRNVRRSFVDYAIYFLTLMFGVCIFYIFNSIESQQSILELSSTQHQMIRSINTIMGYMSVFISAILGFLIVYANRFLIKRRKKELGIYQTLGMKKGQIAFIINIETLIAAVFSLVIGLILGVFFSQGFAVITASLFDVKLKNFRFIMSSAAVVKTLIYFGITFALVMIFSSIEVGRQKLIDLLYADRKNEKFKSPPLLLSVALFILSIICLLVAYYLIIINQLTKLDAFFASVVLGVIGTFLFFISLSGFFLKLIQQNKKVYYRSLNMFVLRQINSKIATTFVSISMVCLMLFVSISCLSNGIGLSDSITDTVKRLTPYDASFSVVGHTNNNDKNDEQSYWVDIDVESFFDNASIPYSEYAKEYVFVKYYLPDIKVDINLNEDRYNSTFIKLSEFNKLLAMQGKDEVTLGKNDFIINCNNDTVRQEYLKYQAQNKITVFGEALNFLYITDYILYNSIGNDNFGVFVVRDELIPDDTPIINTKLCLNYIKSGEKYEETFVSVRKEVMDAVKSYRDQFDEISFGISANLGGTRRHIFESYQSLSISIAYLGVYVGIVFLIISAVVLAITQLSEATDNKQRYALLLKLGADDKMISKALFLQIAVYFASPLILAIIHSTVAISVISNIIESFGKMNVLRESIITFIALVIIYGGYFLATYMGSKRVIMKK